MSCQCEDPRVIVEKIRDVNTSSRVEEILVEHCIGYHLRDGHDAFALLGLKGSEKLELNEHGWVQIDKSYLWVQDEIQEREE